MTGGLRPALQTIFKQADREPEIDWQLGKQESRACGGVPVVLICNDKAVLTDRPTGMFFAAVLFDAPFVVLGMSATTWLSIRTSFLATYAISLCISIRMLRYEGIFATSDPQLPHLSRWVLFLCVSLLASTILVFAQNWKEHNPVLTLLGAVSGLAYPVGAFFASAVISSL